MVIRFTGWPLAGGFFLFSLFDVLLLFWCSGFYLPGGADSPGRLPVRLHV